MESVVILGAGLAGLSTAWHLGERRPWSLHERRSVAGGLAATMEWDNGCRFDYTGHLLHASDPSFSRLLDELLPGALATHRRRAVIQSHGVRTPYPFQANTHGLPPAVVTECLLGFVEARATEAAQPGVEGPEAGDSMARWVRRTFGAGFEKHFFRPYNEKLYRTALEELATDWTTWSVPVPNLEQVVSGALGAQDGQFGYNATFRYPAGGGISALPEALARGLCRPVELGMEAAAVDTARRVVRFADGREAPWRHLVSTMPLPALLGMLEGEGSWAAEAACRLRAVSVVDVNLAVGREDVLDQNWVYFPEPRFSFYRVGCCTSFARGVAPPGVSTLYAEVSVQPGDQPDLEAVEQRVLDDLVSADILRGRGEVLRSAAVHIDPAYVIHDQYRRTGLDGILRRLSGLGIISTGRYGRWHYGTMQSAVLDGREAAGRILAGSTGGGA
jgi:protoporphyrinogen oxidase